MGWLKIGVLRCVGILDGSLESEGGDWAGGWDNESGRERLVRERLARERGAGQVNRVNSRVCFVCSGRGRTGYSCVTS